MAGMFPLKRFVQGPSLHDEQISYTDESHRVSQNVATLSGQEASKIYEEIINLPSSSSNQTQPQETTQSIRKSSRKVTAVKRNIEQEANKGPVPTLSRLMSFCEANNSSSLEQALQQFHSEIDINTKDEYGWTMLMCASCAGATLCVSLLLQYGASWEIKDKKGLTALELAAKNRHEQVCDLLQEWNECYIELCQRKLSAGESGESQETAGIDDDRTNANAVPSESYCASCQIQYTSSKDDHEKSIAHLVCTAQFWTERTHYGIPEHNKGFQLMVKSGWDRNRGLGPEGKGHKFPVKTVLKRNKLGLGNEQEKKMARVTHFGPFDPAAVQEQRERESTVRKREAVRQRNREKRKEINYRRELSFL